MLQLEKVRVPVGRLRAIGPITLQVPPGSWLGILGPSGAGKSVVAKVLAGLIEPEQGQRFLSDPQIDRARILLEGRGIRYVPDSEAFATHLRIDELLKARASLRGYGGRARKRVLEENSQRFHLEDIWRTRLGDLKRSVRRRVALADAFMGKPGLVILDDPFWGCEDLQIRNIRDGILAGEREHVAVAICSRSPNELVPLVERVVELGRSGKQLYSGDWRGWKAQRLKPATYRLVAKGRGSTIERVLKKIQGVESVLWHEGGPYNTFEVRADPSPAVREMIFKIMALKSWPIVELTPEPHPYLDDSGYGREMAMPRSKRAAAAKRKRKAAAAASAREAKKAAAEAAPKPPAKAEAEEAATAAASVATKEKAPAQPEQPTQPASAEQEPTTAAQPDPTTAAQPEPAVAAQPESAVAAQAVQSEVDVAATEPEDQVAPTATPPAATPPTAATTEEPEPEPAPETTDELEAPDTFDDDAEEIEGFDDEDLVVHEGADFAATDSEELIALKSLLAEAEADDAEEADAELAEARGFELPTQASSAPQSAPAAEAVAATESQPASEVRAASEVQPAAEAQRASEVQPVAEAQPVSEGQPAAESVAETKPAPAAPAGDGAASAAEVVGHESSENGGATPESSPPHEQPSVAASPTQEHEGNDAHHQHHDGSSHRPPNSPAGSATETNETEGAG